MFSYT